VAIAISRSGMSTHTEARTERRSHYRYFAPLPLQAADNDDHGRARLAASLAGFEQLLDDFLSHECGLPAPPHHSTARSTADGSVSWHSHSFEGHCRLHRVFGFPDSIEVALRVADIGSCAVRFEMALFPAGSEASAKPLATGSVVRVFVPAAVGHAQERSKPARLPQPLRDRLQPFAPGD